MKRLDLHTILCQILKCPENGKECRAYFQPGPNTKLSYPCIVYHLNDISTNHADNRIYKKDNGYSLTLISKDPDTVLVDDIMELSMIDYDRSFRIDNLNHWVFSIY